MKRKSTRKKQPEEIKKKTNKNKYMKKEELQKKNSEVDSTHWF